MGALDDITWKSLSEDLWLKARRDCIPISGQFELTPLCNFRCRMCYVRLNPTDVSKFGRIHSANEWIDLARQAAKFGMYSITLSGGEPLIHPEFKEIYRKLSSLGLLVGILTNGSLIDESMVELFSEYPPDMIRITLYGASNETYERLCGAANGFDRVMHSVALLKEAKVPFSFSNTITKENYSDIEQVKAIAKAFDVPIAFSDDLNLPVRGAESEAASLRVDISDRIAALGGLKSRAVPVPSSIIQASNEGLLQGLFRNCHAYRTSFFVDWNGDMELCASMSFCHCKPFELGFESAWTQMNDVLSKLQLPEKCISCPNGATCFACAGKRCAESGSPNGISERYCHEAHVKRLYWDNLLS